MILKECFPKVIGKEKFCKNLVTNSTKLLKEETKPRTLMGAKIHEEIACNKSTIMSDRPVKFCEFRLPKQHQHLQTAFDLKYPKK